MTGVQTCALPISGPYYSAIEHYDQASENVECAQDELRWPTAAPLPWELAQPAADDAFPVLSTLSYERRAIYDNQGYYLNPPAPGPENTEQASPNSIESKRRRLSNEAPDAGKRYGCDFPGCVSRFARSSSLAIHKRHHTGAKRESGRTRLSLAPRADSGGLSFRLPRVPKALQRQ